METIRVDLLIRLDIHVCIYIVQEDGSVVFAQQGTSANERWLIDKRGPCVGTDRSVFCQFKCCSQLVFSQLGETSNRWIQIYYNDEYDRSLTQV